MKKITVLMITILLTVVHPAAGETMSKNAGRTITPKELLRITDEEGDFYLKQPSKMKIAPDGGLFLIDENEFLRFDKNGRFLGNQQKKGEGPGEYSHILDYHFSNNTISLYALQPRKWIETDLTGKLLKEYRLDENMSFMRILGFTDERYWAAGAKFESISNENSGAVTINLIVAWGTRDGKLNKTGIKVPEQWYMAKKTSGKAIQISMQSYVPAVIVFDSPGTVYVSNTWEYAIQRIDLETGKTTGNFTRKYERVPFMEEKSEKENENRGLAPKPEFVKDIQGLYLYDNHLLAMTSTVEKGKGVLVDVFTKDGEYIDYFYLALPKVETVNDLRRKPFTFHEKYIITVEPGEDENPEVVKYLIN